ncbi:hypothetical protein [Candidatus Palauibacter sp.]|uniref:hypothetical protein n=1 Tax=Candidatus Palauibacter sp. TaxID=3101350 RepID=UPI003B5C58D5
MAPDALRRLRDLLPGVSLVQVVHVRDAHAIDEAAAVAPLVDAILLDERLLRRFMREVKEAGGGEARRAPGRDD